MAKLLRNAAPGVLTLEAYTPGMPIEELQRRLGVGNAVKLASNENPVGMSARVKEALAAHISATELARYPDGSGFRLKKKLAEMHKIEPERITLGNGSNDIIELLGRVFLGPDRWAMYSAHAFAVYPIITQAQGAQATVVAPRDPDDAQPYGHDLAAFERELNAEIALGCIANPHNPPRTWVNHEPLERR